MLGLYLQVKCNSMDYFHVLSIDHNNYYELGLLINSSS